MRLDWTVCRRFLLQSDVSSVLMVVSQVIAPEASQVLFIQRNDMIQHLAAATADPSLGHSVLPRTAYACANGLETAALEKPEYIAAELRVTVEHDVLVATGKRQRLWCKLKPTERSVKLRLVSDRELGSSCECRVPQFRHRRIAPAELARLELPLLDLLC